MNATMNAKKKPAKQDCDHNSGSTHILRLKLLIQLPFCRLLLSIFKRAVSWPLLLYEGSSLQAGRAPISSAL